MLEPEDLNGEEVSSPHTDHPPVAQPATVPRQFITQLHGKDFVQYAGLLAMAHQQGLKSLSAKFISVTGDLALAEATATF